MSQELMNADQYGFGNGEIIKNENSMMQVEQSRAVAEVQASFVIAKRFPRDEHVSFNKIMKACERPFLAEQATYAYPRGGSVVTGPSIRLAEVLSQYWGNIDCGVREISQSNGSSLAEAYAIDLETNTRVTKIFHVSHDRHTKKGKQRLTDPRDIYEIVANNGARRLRACILAIIPGDITEAAIDQTKKTLLSGKEPIEDRIRKLVLEFDKFGVKVEHLEKKLKHKLESTIIEEVITLGSIYKSIRDGMAKREDFFDMGNNTASQNNLESILLEKKISKKVESIIEKPIIQHGEIELSQKIKNQIQNSMSLDTLYIAADIIREADKDKQDELTKFFKQREKELK